jgi:cytochrome c oxidase subunit II
MRSKAPTPSLHLGWRIFVSLALVFALGKVAPGVQTQPPAKTIVVHARKYGFVPKDITLKRGEAVKLVLISDDVRHGLSVRGMGIRTEINPTHNNELVVTPNEVGDFNGSCSIYCGNGHRDMAFVVHVVE